MNSVINQWAIRHSVSVQALSELEDIFGLCCRLDPISTNERPQTEADAQARVRLEAATKGVRLWRNNVGSLIDARGVPVRYGLANDSKRLNDVVKSADLIGWRKVLIEQRHVGATIAQFVSRECKRPGWVFDPHSKREAAQMAWLMAVQADGGDAAFCTGEGTL